MRRLLLILSPALILAIGVFHVVSSSPSEATPSVVPDIQTGPLSRDVRAALIGAFGPDALDIVVGVEDHVAVLSGNVRERPTQKLASHVAESVDGIIVVHNFLTLTSTAEASAAELLTRDNTLRAEVSRQIVKKIGNTSPNVSVDACDGIVLLSGRLPDNSYHDTVIRIAEGLAGVAGVIDLVHVAWAGSLPVAPVSFSEEAMTPVGIEK